MAKVATCSASLTWVHCAGIVAPHPKWVGEVGEGKGVATTHLFTFGSITHLHKCAWSEKPNAYHVCKLVRILRSYIVKSCYRKPKQRWHRTKLMTMMTFRIVFYIGECRSMKLRVLLSKSKHLNAVRPYYLCYKVACVMYWQECKFM